MGCLEVLRDVPAPEGLPRQPTAGAPQHRRGRQRAAEAGEDAGHPFPRHGHVLEHEDRQQHPDRVVDDPLPLQERRRVLVEPRLTDQRHDDGRARHHQDRAQDDRDGPAEPRDVPSREGAQRPRERRAEHREPTDAMADPAQLAQPQRHPAVEQDDRHAEPDQLRELRAREPDVDDARHGTEEDAADDQHGDGRQPAGARRPIGSPAPPPRRAASASRRARAYTTAPACPPRRCPPGSARSRAPPRRPWWRTPGPSPRRPAGRSGRSARRRRCR